MAFVFYATRTLLFKGGGLMLWLCITLLLLHFTCSVQTANTLTLKCYGVEVLLQKQLALLASSVHLAASSVHPAASSVHRSVLIQTFLQCNSFLLLHTYHLSLIIPT